MTPAEAREIIADHIIAGATDPGEIADQWDMYPEIGEGDWDEIVEVVDQKRPTVDREKYRQAYEVLAERAEG